MSRLLAISLIFGLIAGLLVGGFHNLFTVPVMERAIALEEARAVTDPPAAAGAEETPVSPGGQRIGMVVGTGIYGLILGLVFAGGYTLLRRAQPNWQPLALAATVGILGFWALSLFPFIKFPVNPPGVRRCRDVGVPPAIPDGLTRLVGDGNRGPVDRAGQDKFP